MNSVYITAIICATVTALAWMVYDLRRRRIAAADRRAKKRTIEKEVVVEVPVFQGRGDNEPERPAAAEKPKGKGSLNGYYRDKDGGITLVEGSGKDEQQDRNESFYTRHLQPGQKA